MGSLQNVGTCELTWGACFGGLPAAQLAVDVAGANLAVARMPKVRSRILRPAPPGLACLIYVVICCVAFIADEFLLSSVRRP